MIDLILAALMQVAAGDPSAPQSPETPAAQVEAAAESTNGQQTTWTCRVEQRTGSRLDRRRVCRRQSDEERLRDRLGDDLRDRAAIVAVQPTP